MNFNWIWFTSVISQTTLSQRSAKHIVFCKSEIEFHLGLTVMLAGLDIAHAGGWCRWRWFSFNLVEDIFLVVSKSCLEKFFRALSHILKNNRFLSLITLFFVQLQIWPKEYLGPKRIGVQELKSKKLNVMMIFMQQRLSWNLLIGKTMCLDLTGTCKYYPKMI